MRIDSKKIEHLNSACTLILAAINWQIRNCRNNHKRISEETPITCKMGKTQLEFAKCILDDVPEYNLTTDGITIGEAYTILLYLERNILDMAF